MKRHFCLFIICSMFLFACQRQEEQPATPPEQGGEQAEERQPEQPSQPPEDQPMQPEPMGQQDQSQMDGSGQPAGEVSQQPMGAEGQLPPAEGQALVQYITRTNPYKQWQLWPGKGEMYPGTEPHGVLLTTYVNDIALDAIERKTGRMPAGAIIVKENYGPEKELAAVTTMYKVNGYDPEGGDWFWTRVSPQGRIEEEGRIEGCVSCHRKAQANDYLFTGSISQQGQ